MRQLAGRSPYLNYLCAPSITHTPNLIPLMLKNIKKMTFRYKVRKISLNLQLQAPIEMAP